LTGLRPSSTLRACPSRSPGLSERIRAVSIIDRYLEHARVFYFQNGSEPDYLLASADWMPRNLDHRVEVAFPVLEPTLQRQLRDILEIQLADTAKARLLRPDGRSERVGVGGSPALRFQELLYDLTGGGHARPGR
jgi:polyphosphate kinase